MKQSVKSQSVKPKTTTEADTAISASHAPSFGSKVKKWLPLILIISALIATWQSGALEQLSLANMIKHRLTLLSWVESNWLLAIFAYIALYAGLTAISFPGASFLTIGSGFFFGGLFGGLATVFGATTGAVIIFLAARSSFGASLQARSGAFVSKMIKGFEEDAFQYLLFLRLAPIFPFWVVNVVPAFCNMRIWPYALATFIGIVPGTLAYAYIGAGLDSIIAAQELANPGCADAGSCAIEPSALVTRELVLALAGLALVSTLPILLKKWKMRRSLDKSDIK